MSPREILTRWRASAVRFVIEAIGVTPDAWQAKALEAFSSNDPLTQRIALKACAGPGKTFVEAACGLNFLTCYGEENDHPKGIAVSSTGDNLKTNLWPEFAKLIARSEFLKRALRWTKERIYAVDHPETWFLEARSFNKDANPEEQGRTLSGLHAKRVLFLIDESGDISYQVARTAEQALSNCVWGKIMQAGNPTSHTGMLYMACHKYRSQWHVITITGDPSDPDRSPRISKEWAQEQIDKNGRDNPWVMAYILGEFPSTAINALLSMEDVDRAMMRQYRLEHVQGSQKRLGIDVARGGLDKTSLFPRWGLQAFMPVHMEHARGHDVAARAMVAKQKWEWELCFVDDTGGYGGSVCDSFVQAGVEHVPVNFASKAIDGRFYNKRSEMLFLMADWIKKHGALPDMPSLREELPALQYSFKSGKLIVVEKDQIKEQIGHSPDDTDALALTFALPEMPGVPMELAGMNTYSAKNSDFDPFRNENKRPENPDMEKYLVGI